MHDLLREVDLEMPDDLAALLAPPTHGRILGILDQMTTELEHGVQGLAVPCVEDVG